MTKNPHAVALGRKGGLAGKGSPAKKTSGRANLQKARAVRAAQLAEILRLAGETVSVTRN